MKTVTQEVTSQAPAEQIVSTGKASKKSGNRVGYNYIIVKSYKESQKNDVVKCLYIKSLVDFGFCVIKEGSYGDTKDKQGRDIIDRLKWQQQLHQQLQGKLRMPRFLGHFEENGNYYLVIEHIRGKSLQKMCSEHRKELRSSLISGGKLGIQFLDYLIQIAGILKTLHAEQIVHRDATPNNYMVTSGGKVSLIDMEMCYSLKQVYPTPAFQLGTHGYMSPQQEVTEVPTTAEDIFALGAIMLQMWSGVSPGKLTNEPIKLLSKKTQFFIPDKQIADLVNDCLSTKVELRPNADKIINILTQYRVDLDNNTPRSINKQDIYSKKEILSTVQEAINTLSTTLLADEEKGWFADDMRPSQGDDKHKLRKVWYASYNRGVTGIIYALSKAKLVGLNVTKTYPFIYKGIDLIIEKYIGKISKATSGLHFGSDSIAAIISISIKDGLIPATPDYVEWIELLLQKENNSLNISTGVSGQGIANIICKSFANAQKTYERLDKYAAQLISRQEKNGSWINGYYKQKYSRKKTLKITRGFLEGMAGIIYFLLEYGYKYNHSESQQAANKGLRWLMLKAKHINGNIYWVSSRDRDLDYGWANGTAGIALTFIKAFEYTNNPIYFKYSETALYSIPARITDTNIGQRNGLSGLGEIYIEAWKVLKNIEWLQRADWIAQIIMQMKKQHPKHGCYWIVEHERQPVANFMTGNSGVIHFLLRYCSPEKIGFPLMPE